MEICNSNGIKRQGREIAAEENDGSKDQATYIIVLPLD